MPHGAPDLRFGRSDGISGFTAAGIAAFDDLRPAAIVRELIQNAMDAAREADRTPAHVLFRLSRIERTQIPGMASYKEALRHAVATQRRVGGDLAQQAQLVVARMKEELARDEIEVLTVLDNGVGLDRKRLTALLSDGVSVKGTGATGTYGNGHTTAIPASNLRYLLYAGVTSSGRRIACGHAVLASHFNRGGTLRSGDGFLVKGFGSGGRPYHFATGRDIPHFFKDILTEIRSSWDHGSAVTIPGFNHFLHKGSDDLDRVVSAAAAANFFVAIARGDLIVTVEDARPSPEFGSSTLDKSNLLEILRRNASTVQRRAFLNGRDAFEANEAHRGGSIDTIKTSSGDVEIHLLERPSGRTRIDICRNGMWITSGLPGITSYFGDRVPFHAVLCLDSVPGDDLHEFVRLAEGPLHDAIHIKRLPPLNRRACRAAFHEIKDWIRDNTQEIRTDAFAADDFLSIDSEDGTGTGGKTRSNFWGSPSVIAQNPNRQRPFEVPVPRGTGEPSGATASKSRSSPPRNPDQRRRPSLPECFRVVSCPLGSSRRSIHVESIKDFNDAELRLVVDEALDATCLRPGQDEYTPLELDNVQIDGKEATQSALVKTGAVVTGIRIGQLRAGEVKVVNVDYGLAGDFAGMAGASLRVQLFQSAPSDTAESTSD